MITKIILGTLASGGIVTASAVSYEYLVKPQNLEQKLKWDGYRILSTKNNEDQESWTKIAKKWNQDENKLSNFVDSKSEETGTDELKIKALKEKCSEVIKEKLPSENYHNAKNYCSVSI